MARVFKGLSAVEVEKSRQSYGTNELVKIPTRGFFARFLDNLSDPVIKILLVALALQVVFTFGSTNLVEVFGIVAAILIATTVSTISEYGSERAFAKMESENSDSYAHVIREGITQDIPSASLVVGDIIVVHGGERIEADGTVVDGWLDVDQSALNGENKEVRKSPSKCGGTSWELSDGDRVYRGSIATLGDAVIKVGRVGVNTFYGMVARDVQAETRVSPLKLRLSNLAKQISIIGYIVAALVGITYLFNAFLVDNGFNFGLIMSSLRDTKYVFSTLIQALTMMITIIVVAVPEGLPMMITVVLSANMKRMIKDKILVKKLVGIETAGSLNILFTDKTGTLTEGNLSVDKIITEDGATRRITSVGGEIWNYLRLNAEYNTDAEKSPSGIVGGNATDRALAECFRGEKGPKEQLVGKTHFTSESKYSSVVFADGLELFKGAPEVILPRCGFALKTDGAVVASDLRAAERALNVAISRGERVLAVAIKRPSDNVLTFVALISLKDKIRCGVIEAVKDVMSAGIQIVMLTGDNKDTAVHIAQECGFYKASAGHLALTSADLREMSDDEVKKLLPSLRVLARALPQDKTRLVRLSQELDYVVGMTGDGVNDAPSLKLADVGFSMGSGTDIAKSAGDIVIIDNSFSSISKTILYGRTIFKSIRKFITFQLIMNLAACGITLIGQIIGVDNPITIIQMLWVNIIMDTLGGLAFAGEAPLRYYMNEKPKRRDEPILSRSVIGHIALNGAFTLLLLVLFLRLDYFKDFYADNRAHMTAFYALFIFSGLFNCFTARSERLWVFSNITKNKPFVFIMLLVSAIQLLIIYHGGDLFRSTPLTFCELILPIGFAATILVFDAARRIIDKLK